MHAVALWRIAPKSWRRRQHAMTTRVGRFRCLIVLGDDGRKVPRHKDLQVETHGDSHRHGNSWSRLRAGSGMKRPNDLRLCVIHIRTPCLRTRLHLPGDNLTNRVNLVLTLALRHTRTNESEAKAPSHCMNLRAVNVGNGLVERYRHCTKDIGAHRSRMTSATLFDAAQISQ